MQQGKVRSVLICFLVQDKDFFFRPACADKSEIFNLKCSDGGVPTLGVGTFPKCANGNLVCQDGDDLKCLVNGQLTEEVPNFGM